MKVTEWASYGNDKLRPIISDWSCSTELFEKARQAVIKEIVTHNYHFTGTYHQNGEFGCPIIDDRYSFELSMRDWGALMADAYPNESYKGFSETNRCLKWAWVCNESNIVPSNNKRELLNKLYKFWVKYPELRFGQIIEMIKYRAGNHNDLFYVSDESIIKSFEKENEE